MEEVKEFTWKVGGPAGFGIMSTGYIFEKMFSRKGYYVADGKHYPSLIQGGHNTYTVRVSSEKIYSLKMPIDILIALDENSIKLHLDEVVPGGFVVYDSGIFKKKDFDYEKEDVNFISVPLDELAKKVGAPKIVRNNVALGVSVALLNYDFSMLKEIITENFEPKGEKIVNFNIDAAKAGCDYIKEEYGDVPKIDIQPITAESKLLMSGNDGVYMGAIKAGCKFYAAYPMTPSSSLLHSFASAELDFNIVTKHAESEIAVINMAVGASFMGARAMVGTSGGGFALMNEGLAAAAMTETPIVVVLGQRPAPATGIPTYTEQGDMMYAVHAAHGEFPRVVMAPGDPSECFYMAGDALNLAEKYQIPVIILLDKFLAEHNFSSEGLDEDKIRIDRTSFIDRNEDIGGGRDYLRYKDTEDGVSPRVIVGLQDGVHLANTDEHDEYGFSEDSGKNRKKMMDKRFRKLRNLQKEVKGPNLYGPPDADTTLISWGSCKIPILEALKDLNHGQGKANLIHFNYLMPFPKKRFVELMKNVNKGIVVENNKTSQLSKLIRENTGIKIPDNILKYEGRQFFPEEIIEKL